MERNPLGLIDGVALGERSCPTDIESVDGMNLPGRPARGAGALAASARAVPGIEHQLAADPDRPPNAVQIVRTPCARAKRTGHFIRHPLPPLNLRLPTHPPDASV